MVTAIAQAGVLRTPKRYYRKVIGSFVRHLKQILCDSSKKGFLTNLSGNSHDPKHADNLTQPSCDACVFDSVSCKVLSDN